jgi:threonine dehydratase
MLPRYSQYSLTAETICLLYVTNHDILFPFIRSHNDYCVDYDWLSIRARIVGRVFIFLIQALMQMRQGFFVFQKSAMTTKNSNITLAGIREAHKRLHGSLAYTPCKESSALSELTGCRIFCKQEHLQRTGSFKERGARNALLRLSKKQAERGVIAASAGNHALGLAWHGRELGIAVTVVMPKFAPLTKITRCRQFGAQVILHGDSFDEAREEASRLAALNGSTYIHPFNHPHVIEGQGTLALEILEQVPEVDTILVPVGGGGLLAGIVTAVKELRPDVEVIGVEPASAACFTTGQAAGHPVRIPSRFTIADGLAVVEAGSLTLEVAGPKVDRLIQVSEQALALAILRFAENEKTIVEGAGAIGLAALLESQDNTFKGRNVVLILSGGNIDLITHTQVIERGLAADGRIYRFRVLLSDRPGGLAHLSKVLAQAGANITEIIHDRTFSGPDLSRTYVLCKVETRNWQHIHDIQQQLTFNGIELMPNGCL